MFHMQRHRRLPEEHARFYSAEISCALNYLHERGGDQQFRGTTHNMTEYSYIHDAGPPYSVERWPIVIE